MKSQILMALSAAMLCACGGGGGPAVTPPVAAASAYNMDAAFTSLAQTGAVFSNLSATVNGTQYRLSFSTAPTTDGTLAGSTQTYHRFVETIQISANGTTVATGTSTQDYLINPMQIAAALLSSGPLTVYQQKTSLPTAGAIGQLGAWSTGAVSPYVEATFTSATTATVWSLEPDTTSTALACITTTTTTTGTVGVGGSTSTGKLCLRITPTGQIQGAQMTMPIGGVQTLFQ